MLDQRALVASRPWSAMLAVSFSVIELALARAGLTWCATPDWNASLLPALGWYGI